MLGSDALRGWWSAWRSCRIYARAVAVENGDIAGGGVAVVLHFVEAVDGANRRDRHGLGAGVVKLVRQAEHIIASDRDRPAHVHA